VRAKGESSLFRCRSVALICGAAGGRTRVQAPARKAFYMLSQCLRSRLPEGDLLTYSCNPAMLVPAKTHSSFFTEYFVDKVIAGRWSI